MLYNNKMIYATTKILIHFKNGLTRICLLDIRRVEVWAQGYMMYWPYEWKLINTWGNRKNIKIFCSSHFILLLVTTIYLSSSTYTITNNVLIDHSANGHKVQYSAFLPHYFVVAFFIVEDS